MFKRSNAFSGSLFLMFLFLCGMTICCEAGEKRQFQLVITDFFFPLFTNEQNKLFPAKFVPTVKITGLYVPTEKIIGTTYKETTYYEPNCMVGVTCFPFGGKYKTKTEIIIKNEEAEILDTSAEQQKITFQLSAEKTSHFQLNGIALTFPLTPLLQQENIPPADPYSVLARKETTEIFIPVSLNPEKSQSHYFKNMGGTGRNISLQDRNHTVSPLGIVFQLNQLENGQPGTVPVVALNKPDTSTFTPAERYRMVDSIDVGTRSNAVQIHIPPALPRWHQTEETTGNAIISVRREVIALSGTLLYKNQFNSTQKYNKEEIWKKTQGKLAHIYSNPYNYNHDLHKDSCPFYFGIDFYPDGTEKRYFTDRRNGREKEHIIRNADISPLLVFEKDRETINAKEPQGLAQCKRAINDAKLLLTSSREKLEEEFNAYRKLIEEAKKASPEK